MSVIVRKGNRWSSTLITRCFVCLVLLGGSEHRVNMRRQRHFLCVGMVGTGWPLFAWKWGWRSIKAGLAVC